MFNTKNFQLYFHSKGNRYVQKDYRTIRGEIFENWIISEHLKHYANKGREAALYFWRDQHGHEIDLAIDQGTHLDLIEIKSGMTFNTDYFKNINWLNKLQKRDNGICIYGGDKLINLGNQKVVPWSKIF